MVPQRTYFKWNGFDKKNITYVYLEPSFIGLLLSYQSYDSVMDCIQSSTTGHRVQMSYNDYYDHAVLTDVSYATIIIIM